MVHTTTGWCYRKQACVVPGRCSGRSGHVPDVPDVPGVLDTLRSVLFSQLFLDIVPDVPDVLPFPYRFKHSGRQGGGSGV